MERVFKKGSIALKALVALVSAAMVLSLSPICVSRAYADSNYLEIYYQVGDTGTPVLVKSWYKQGGFTSMMGESLKTSTTSEYAAANAVSGTPAMQVYVAKQYVTVQNIFAACDSEFTTADLAAAWASEGAKVVINNGSKDTTVTIADTDGYNFYPNLGYDSNSALTTKKSSAVASPLTFYLSYWSGSVDVAADSYSGAAAQALITANADTGSNTSGVMYGITQDALFATSTSGTLTRTDANKSGRFVYGATKITLVVADDGGSTGGTTTEDPVDPIYTISSAADLTQLAKSVNEGDDYTGKTVTLAADITADESFCAIGTETNAFDGTFDGAGHTITLNYSTDIAYAGLFGNNAGTIKDLTVAGTVTSSTTGDYVAGVAAVNSGTISNVISAVAVSAESAYNVGGIAGYNTGAISNCMVTSAVLGNSHVGGIAGVNEGTIAKCAVSADVDGVNNSSKNGVGGIVGFNGDKNQTKTASVSDCYVTGTIGRSGQNWLGGIAGFNNNLSSIQNCYMAGSMPEGAGFNAAICGHDESTSGTVDNNYAIEGLPTGAKATSAKETGISKTAAEMKTAEFVTALGSAYKAVEGGYPVLAWQASSTVSVPAVISAGDVAISGNFPVAWGAVSAQATTLDASSEAYKAAAAKAKDASKLIGIFEVDLFANGAQKHDGFGSATLTFVVDKADGTKVIVGHIHQNGSVTYENATVQNGVVTISVTDLSTFTIEEGVLPETGDNTATAVVVGLMLVAAVGLVVARRKMNER